MKELKEKINRLTPSDFSKMCMLYPRLKANTPDEFVDKIGSDERTLIGVTKLVDKQLESY